MRVRAGVVATVALFTLIFAGGCKRDGAGTDSSGKLFDNKQITCSGATGSEICKITLRELKAHGAPCKINDDGTLGYHADYPSHRAFSISVRARQRLTVDTEDPRHLARFRDFTLIEGKHCPKRPFLIGTKNGFGEDVTGFPVDFARHTGCVYELAVQTDEVDDQDQSGNHPKDPTEGDKGYFCVDPHFEMVDVP